MRYIQAECPQLRVIILSVHDDPVVIREITAAGTAGYVLQSRAVTDLIPIIEQVLVGNGYILADVSAYDLRPKHR